MATPQMAIRQGLQQFGEAGDAAVEAKMTQLHKQEVMKPVTQKELTMEQ